MVLLHREALSQRRAFSLDPSAVPQALCHSRGHGRESKKSTLEIKAEALSLLDIHLVFRF
jgi:hypothetical protein